ncbi:hypothetical protein MIR68_004558 [Amoeboaphelidium protococcarum]|nr:hypothetical protein MIR68_004558 [Amoeboaphelidium protococcarum]
MSTISLKVLIADQGTTKTLQFDGRMTISEVCKDIKERLGDKTSGATDHGIYYPFLTKWLASNRTLDFYDLKSGDSVEYKKKHRPLRVKLMDETMKTVLVDDSQTVQEMTEAICKRIGIANFDEYSLQLDNADGVQTSSGSEKTLKKSTRAGDDKEKMASGDRWLSPEKSLPEQGVAEADILLLKKKFFFSDQNIDRNDPIQLNLLFVQSRDMIVSGQHPCNMEEASQLAALQCQVQYGNHEPDKHKPGFIKLKEFVPPEYQKDKKDLEKKIYQEHRKLQGLNELNAKFRYVQLCRSLKTYGVTFFLVKEKVPGKSKIVPRLLGVTRDSIMRMDAETKEIVKIWPLTTLRRWAAAQNSFTLDFGDYADSYYSVQTNEGEKISQLIAGYIDIILKKRKDAERNTADEDEQVAIAEDNIKAVKGTAVNIVGKKAGRAVEVDVASAGISGEEGNRVGMKQGVTKRMVAQSAAYGSVEYSNAIAQQSLMQSINNGFAAVSSANQDLSMATQLPPIGNDQASQQWKMQTMEVNRQTVATQVGSHLAAAAAIVNVTAIDLEQVDFGAVGANVSTLSQNLNQMSASIKMLAALSDGVQGDKLLECARNLAAATGKLLGSVQPMLGGDGDPSVRAEVLRQGQEISKQAFNLLSKIGEAEVSQFVQQQLVDAAKEVAKATIALVSQGSKPIAQEALNDPQFQQLQPEIVYFSKQAGIAAESLVTCTMVVAPSIQFPQCQDQLWEGTLIVKDAVNDLHSVVEPFKAKIGYNSRANVELMKHSQKVNEAIANLIEKAKNFKLLEGAEGTDPEFDAIFDKATGAINQLSATNGNSGNIIDAAKNLTLATTGLVNLLKARGQDPAFADDKDSMIQAAKRLAEATTRMIQAAKDAAKNPNDQEKQRLLKLAVADVEKALLAASGDNAKKKALGTLAEASKRFAGSVTQLIGAAKKAGPSNRNQASQIQLNTVGKQTADNVSDLIYATKAHLKAVDDTGLQSKLIQSAKGVVGIASNFVVAAKSVASTTGDISAQQSLSGAIKQHETDLENLTNAIALAEAAISGSEYVTGMKAIKAALEDIMNGQEKLAKGQLRAPLGQSQETAATGILDALKIINPGLLTLVNSANQNNESACGSAVLDTTSAFQSWASYIKTLAALSIGDPDVQRGLFEAAAELAGDLEKMLKNAKLIFDKNINKSPQEIAECNRAIAEGYQHATEIIATVNSALPGQRDIDHALNLIAASVDLFANGPPVKEAGETFQSAQNKLNSAAAALALACNSLVNASRNGNVADLKGSANQFEDAFNRVVLASKALIATTNDPQAQANVQSLFNELANTSYSTLQASKHSQMDSNQRGQLAEAAKLMADSISKLLDTCTATAPGIQECNQADKLLLQALGRLDYLSDPSVVQRSENYYQCVNSVADTYKVVGAQVSTASAALRSGDAVKLGQALLTIAQAVDSMASKQVRAAYLVATADPSSVPGKPGAFDASQFTSNATEIKNALSLLINPNSKQQDILAAASAIAKCTAALCANCKNIQSNSAVAPAAKAQFIQYSKNIATQTAALVQNIKLLASSQSDANRAKCEASAVPLVDSVDGLVNYAVSPEFSPTPAQISPVALQKVQPMLEAGKSTVSVTQDAVANAKQIITSSNLDMSTTQMFNSQIKGINESFRQVLTGIKSSAPGQNECAEAIEQISACISDIDSTLLQVDVGSLSMQDNSNSSAQGDSSVKDSLVDNIKALASLVGMIAIAAKGQNIGENAENLPSIQLGSIVQQFSSTFKPTSDTAIVLAQTVIDKNYQHKVLDGVKSVGESSLYYLTACKEAGGDTSATQAHQKLEQSKIQLDKDIAAVIGDLEGSAEGTQEVSEITSAIQNQLNSIAEVENRYNANQLAGQGWTFPLVVQEIAKQGKQLVDLTADIIGKSVKPNPETVIGLTGQLQQSFDGILMGVSMASSLNQDSKVKGNIMDAARMLGNGTVKLAESLKVALIASKSSANGTVDNMTRQKIANAAKELSSAVAKLILASKEGSRGLMACEQVLQQISDLITDLESSIIFAEAGQLDPTNKQEVYAMYKDDLEKYARDLVEISKSFVAATASANQDDLANSAQSSYSNLQSLVATTIKGASAITSSDRNMQEQLLSSAKAVADRLSQLINSALEASAKPMSLSATGTVSGQGMEIMKMRADAKNFVTQIGDYIKLVKLVGDESSRGLRTIETAIREVQECTKSVESGTAAHGTSTPEEVVGLSRIFAQTSAYLVSASGKANINNQDDLINSVLNTKKCLLDLLRSGAAAIDKAPDDKKVRMIGALKLVSNAAVNLFNKTRINLESASNESKSAIQVAAKDIAISVNGIVEAAGELIPGGYVDPNDPNVIAERELLAAASSIENAAKKLAALKPAERKNVDENLPFEEQILEAAKAIAAATGALVRSATNAQREIVAKGKSSNVSKDKMYSQDGQWSDGLVSAAKSVAAATGDLCETANAAVKGQVQRERVVAASRAVSSSTVQLLTSASVKADHNSQAQMRLKAAGKSVQNATEQLVKAAESSMAFDDSLNVDQMKEMGGNTSGAMQRAKELEAQARILQMEKELEMARNRFAGMRKAKYGK